MLVLSKPLYSTIAYTLITGIKMSKISKNLKICLALVMLTLLMAVATVSACEVTPPPQTPSIVLTPNSGFAVTQIVGSNFGSCKAVTIKYDGVVVLTPNLKTDDDGAFSVIITIPCETAVGAHTITAIDTQSHLATAVFMVVSEVGQTGATGATGAQGEQGVAGVNGVNGTNGAQGIQGDTGEQGHIGYNGATGATGSTGATGATGIQGATGAMGATGQQGVIGATGVQGAQGIQGLTGQTGQTGTTGAQGVQGLTGLKGDTGAQGAQGEQGVMGVQGAQGLQGVAGQDGTNGLNGASGATLTASNGSSTPLWFFVALAVALVASLGAIGYCLLSKPKPKS